MSWHRSLIIMNQKILILGRRPHSPSMIGMGRELIPGRSGKGISFIDKEYPSLRIAWRWDPISIKIYYYILVSSHPKTTNHSKSSRKSISPNKPLTTQRPTTLARSSVPRAKLKRSSRNAVDAGLQFGVEVLTRNKRISFRISNPFISLLSLIMTNSWIRGLRRCRRYWMVKRMKKSRPCYKGSIRSWWVSLMTTTVITASSKAIEHGHVRSGRKTRFKSPAQSAASPHTQPPTAHKNKPISRSSKQTKSPCYSNPSMTSSGSNYKQSLKEAWRSLPISTGKSCWPLGKIRQV